MPSSPSNASPEDPADFAARERAAAEWFVRKDRGLTPTEKRELSAWLAADERHAALFSEIEQTWNDLPAIASMVPAVARGRSEPENPPSSRRMILRKRSLSDSFRSFVWIPAGLAFAAALVFAYMGWWRPAHYSGEAATRLGGLRMVALPDGSSVQLNTDSVIAVDFCPTERRVCLERGEAHFTVSKDPERPFIVVARGVAVRAVGTAFNVRVFQEWVDVLVTEGEVALGAAAAGVRNALVPRERNPGGRESRLGGGHGAEDGVSRGDLDADSPGDRSAPLPDAAAAFHPPSAKLILRAGNRATIPLAAAELMREPSVETLSTSAIERILAWQKQRVEFADAPLAEIVAEFNRYNRHQLAIADPGLAERRFGGSFSTSDYESFIQVLEATFGVSVRRGKHRTVLSAH